jgi:hypothetical protein
MNQLTISVYPIYKQEVGIILGDENEEINQLNILLSRLISMGKL